MEGKAEKEEEDLPHGFQERERNCKTLEWEIEPKRERERDSIYGLWETEAKIFKRVGRVGVRDTF